ncbi:MAG: TPM domain-containing protein [Moraxella sp.]|nr:TPM domain-containing protein [Moraxella sp.]
MQKVSNPNSKSLTRLLRHTFCMPILFNRWLNKDVKNQLSTKIAQAEEGHNGEIVLAIENHLPLSDAYHIGCRERAIKVFSSCKVWDTEQNTGVLIYLNLRERNLQIIADRGINQKVSPDTWQTLCQETLVYFKKQQMQTGLITLIEAVSQILKTHYPSADPHGNELDDTVIVLK